MKTIFLVLVDDDRPDGDHGDVNLQLHHWQRTVHSASGGVVMEARLPDGSPTQLEFRVIRLEGDARLFADLTLADEDQIEVLHRRFEPTRVSMNLNGLDLLSSDCPFISINDTTDDIGRGGLAGQFPPEAQEGPEDDLDEDSSDEWDVDDDSSDDLAEDPPVQLEDFEGKASYEWDVDADSSDDDPPWRPFGSSGNGR